MNLQVENNYENGTRVKVRRLSGVYEISNSWMIGKYRRYNLVAVPDTGAVLPVTEAYGDVLQLASKPEPAPELTLTPDTEPQDPKATEALPVGQASPDAFVLDDGAFGGELDPYSPGAQQPLESEDIERREVYSGSGELQNPRKLVRRFPINPRYEELRGIIYNARFKGLEGELPELDPGTPVGVVVTRETNGSGIWIVTMGAGCAGRYCQLEVFYPSAPGAEADALEYAVLLALRQVPIRSEDLETLLLSL
jgi:hypothetical protein